MFATPDPGSRLRICERNGPIAARIRNHASPLHLVLQTSPPRARARGVRDCDATHPTRPIHSVDSGRDLLGGLLRRQDFHAVRDQCFGVPACRDSD